MKPALYFQIIEEGKKSDNCCRFHMWFGRKHQKYEMMITQLLLALSEFQFHVRAMNINNAPGSAEFSLKGAKWLLRSDIRSSFSFFMAPLRNEVHLRQLSRQGFRDFNVRRRHMERKLPPL
uniref:Uncharacterized protein n=1 Tax=Romanomermis culicivorax TaxID=13658 RepID=A0A915IWX1_ROMCU